MSDEKDHTAPYPKSSPTESRSITILRYYTNEVLVKLQNIQEMDKIPNSDGRIELTEENQKPIGLFDAQLKSIPRDKLDPPRIPVYKSFFSYSKKSILPTILIGVDVENEKIYWKLFTIDDCDDYLSRCEGESIIVEFPKENEIIKDSLDTYYNPWMKIIEEYQFYKKLHQGTSIEKIEAIQKHLEGFQEKLRKEKANIKYDIKDNKLKINYSKEGPLKFNIVFNKEELKSVNFEEFLNEMHKKGDSLILTKDEIERIEFEDEEIRRMIKDKGLEKIEIKPSYIDKKIYCRFELVDPFLIRNDLIISPLSIDPLKMRFDFENISDTYLIITILNPSNGKFTLNYNPIEKPPNIILEMLDFFEKMSKSRVWNIRERGSNDLILKLDLDSEFNIQIDDILKETANSLYIIESITRKKFTIPERLPEDDLLNMRLITDLLTKGHHESTADITEFTVNLEGARNLLRLFREKGSIEKLSAPYPGYARSFLGEDIELGNIKIIFPPVVINNEKEVEGRIEEGVKSIVLKFRKIIDSDCFSFITE